MLCTNCGAQMLDTDQFCPKCGAKAIRDKRCPQCGTVLREGTAFCHKCGCPVAGTDGAGDAAVRRSAAVPEYRAQATGQARKRRADNRYAEELYEDDRYEDDRYAEDDYEDESYEDDGREGGVDFLTVMTVVVGIAVLAVVALLGYRMYREYVQPDYGKIKAEQEQKLEDGGQTEDGAEADEAQAGKTMLVVLKNANVRDNPDTSDSNVLKVAKAGEEYEYVDKVEDGQWYEIFLEDGTVGYIYYELVEEK